MTWEVVAGDARRVPLAAGSVDAVICDPPYPEIDRPYGRMTEPEWHAMMRAVVPECRRILKPTGSAVFVLQPNRRSVGSMRLWLWEFVAWAGKDWNLVQDVWWWNHETLPMTKSDPNALRPSLKACVWLGPKNCYRDGASVRWVESQWNLMWRMSGRCTDKIQVRRSRASVRDTRSRSAAVRNGGVTAFNVLPIGADGKSGSIKHSARTPLDLCDWWVRYISPPGGVVCDPFCGSGSTGVAAVQLGRRFLGVEKKPEYIGIARARLADAMRPVSKLDPARLREPARGQLSLFGDDH